MEQIVKEKESNPKPYESNEKLKFKSYDITTPKFTLNYQKFYARVVDILDGDTIALIINLFNNFYKFNVRIHGIDTCEMKSKDSHNKELAVKARDTVFYLVCNESITKDFITKDFIRETLNSNVFLVWVECFDFDKYGRLLANVFVLKNDKKDESIGEYLLKHKLAYEYLGEKKLSESQQLEIIKND